MSSRNQWESCGREFSLVWDTRRTVVFGCILDLLLARGASKAVDVGSGDGGFSRLLLNHGFDKVAMVERSSELVAMCKAVGADFPGKCHVAEDMDDIADRGYHAVIWNALWMCLDSRDSCVALLRKSLEKLLPGGVVLAAASHPCFLDRRFSCYATDFLMRNYFAEGQSYQVKMWDRQTEIEFSDWHWSLGEMFRQAAEAKLCVVDLIELGDRHALDSSHGIPWIILVMRPCSELM